MIRFLLALLLLSSPAFAQGYINPPVYATGVVNETRTGTVTTILKQAYAPGNINVINTSAIDSWTVVFPSPAFDGQLITIGCPLATITSLSYSAVNGDTVVPGGPASCTAGLGAASTYQFHSSTWTPLSFPGPFTGTISANQISGGQLNGVPIGATNPRMGIFTTIDGDASAARAAALGTTAAQTLERAIADTGITPQMFGAKCDGVTDDGTAFSAWAASFTPGGFYSIPGKECHFSTPITFPSVDHVTLNGNQTLLIYTGAATDPNILTIGATSGIGGDGCSVHNWAISNLNLYSNTTMTAGDAVRLNYACSSRLDKVNIGKLLNGGGQLLYNGLHFDGGNSDLVWNSGIANSAHDGLVVNGDSTAQFTDFMIGGDTAILGNTTGIRIAGNVGGFVGMSGLDVLENHNELVVDQSQVTVPNSQIFFDAATFFDLTTNVQAGEGFGIHILDPGGPQSILSLTGTWIASSVNTCLAIDEPAGGSGWTVNYSGGIVTNCQSSGIYTNNTNNTVNVTGTAVFNNVNFAINNGAGTVTKCGVLFKGNPAGNTFGTVGSSC